MPDTNTALRQHLTDLLDWNDAHATFDRAVDDFPARLRGVTPTGLPHSGWQLLEHIRLAQDDILRFSRNHDGSYRKMKWPDDYWPSSAEPLSTKAWSESVHGYLADRKAFAVLVADPKQDLFTPFPWGKGQTLLREVLLVADHTAYHVGQMIYLRRLLGAWKE
jgi:hypothetical protein